AQGGADCAAVNACLSTREVDLYCEEDGCRPRDNVPFAVACDGTIATMTKSGVTGKRDCALALAACDPKSPTGCTDRHFSSCPEGGVRSDHCDGDVRLGCDGGNQVSYRDCARLGGVCGA